MMIGALSVAWALLVSIMIARAVIQFRNYPRAGDDTDLQELSDRLPFVSVVIPARNERGRIGRCVQAILAQDYAADRFEVVVVDDNSNDGTATEARLSNRNQRRLTVMAAGDLPTGWTGKSFACWRGAQEVKGEWLLFLDADTVPQPALLRSAVATARAHGLDFLSLEPFQQMNSFVERLMMPAGMFLVAVTQDLRRINDPHSRQATANGQCLLVRREPYEVVGGHAAVCMDVAEDQALANRVKRAKYKIGLVGGEHLIATRMYQDAGTLWSGLSKNLCNRFAGPGGTVIAGIAAIAIALAAVAVPGRAVLDALRQGGFLATAAAVLACCGTLSLTLVHLGTARHLRIPSWYGCLFPLGYAADGVLALYAAWRSLRGTVDWKGRTISTEVRQVRRAPQHLPSSLRIGA